MARRSDGGVAGIIERAAASINDVTTPSNVRMHLLLSRARHRAAHHLNRARAIAASIALARSTRLALIYALVL